MARFSTTLIAAAALAAAAGCGALDTVKARQLAREGNAAYRASDYPAAVAKYREAAKLDPDTPNLYLNLGYALFSIYDPANPAARQFAAEAIDAFDKHLAQSPKDEKARSFRIKILLRAAPTDPAMADKAYAYFNELLKQNPADVEVRQFLVTLFIDSKRYDQAVTHFGPALQANPKDLETMKILAIVADKSGRVQEAADWYRRRAQAAPAEKQATLFYELGTYLWNVLQYQPHHASGIGGLKLADQGIEACRTAMSLKPEYAEAMAYANLLYLKRAAQEPNEQGKYFSEMLAFELRTEAGKILGARKEKEGAKPAEGGAAPQAPQDPPKAEAGR